MKKINFLIGIGLFATLILTGCAISVNTTRHNEQPWVGNPFDMSRTDYTFIKEVSYEFSGTYVFGIGGWKSKSKNAVDELLTQADLSKRQDVVNITYKTRINVIICGLVVKRVTSAKGQLIQYKDDDTKNQEISISGSLNQESTSTQLAKLASIEKYHNQLIKAAKQSAVYKYKTKAFKSYERLYTAYTINATEEQLSLLEQIQKVMFKYIIGNLPADFEKAFTNDQSTDVIVAIFKQYM